MSASNDVLVKLRIPQLFSEVLLVFVLECWDFCKAGWVDIIDGKFFEGWGSGESWLLGGWVVGFDDGFFLGVVEGRVVRCDI